VPCHPNSWGGDYLTPQPLLLGKAKGSQSWIRTISRRVGEHSLAPEGCSSSGRAFRPGGPGEGDGCPNGPHLASPEAGEEPDRYTDSDPGACRATRKFGVPMSGCVLAGCGYVEEYLIWPADWLKPQPLLLGLVASNCAKGSQSRIRTISRRVGPRRVPRHPKIWGFDERVPLGWLRVRRGFGPPLLAPLAVPARGDSVVRPLLGCPGS
jgi:hypothetical protein